MGVREFKLPGDIDTIIDLIPPSFQYPENPEWSLAEDEVEGMVDSMKGVRKIWPLVRFIQLLVPSARDIMRGFVWEEAGQAVGLVNVIRIGSTDRWLIGNVSVLPDYRRRGIARQLVEASVDYAQRRGAKSMVLDVIDKNLPAYALYEALGFECYSGQTELIFDGDAPPEMLSAPNGYRFEPISISDWQLRYDLANRITPGAVKHYMPVEKGQFRQPAILRLFLPIIIRAMGSAPSGFAAIEAASNTCVAAVQINARRRAGGVNSLRIMLDPVHPDIAPYLVRRGLHEVWQVSPDRRVDLSVVRWQPALLQAALDAGFTAKYNYDSLGMVVQPSG